MQAKIDKITDELKRAYRVFRYTEYTGTEAEVSYMDGYIAGMKKVIEILIQGCETSEDTR